MGTVGNLFCNRHMLPANAILLAVACTLSALLILLGLPSCMRECRKQKGDVPKVTPAPHDAADTAHDSSQSESESESESIEPAPVEPDAQEPTDATLRLEDGHQAAGTDLSASAFNVQAHSISTDPLNLSCTSVVEANERAACDRQGNQSLSHKLLPPLPERPIPPPVAKHINRHVPPDS